MTYRFNTKATQFSNQWNGLRDHKILRKIVINGQFSIALMVNAVVPQGSLLAPNIFLIYIKHLHKNIHKSKTVNGQRLEIDLSSDPPSPIFPELSLIKLKEVPLGEAPCLE